MARAETLKILWLSTVLLTFQSAMAFVLIGTNRTRGFAVLLTPCAVMLALILLWHETANQIALAGLCATGLGFVLIGAMSLAARVHRNLLRGAAKSSTGEPTTKRPRALRAALQ